MQFSFLSKGYRKPILLLFFLAPLAGEGLSGSTPPLAFLNPGILFLLGSLYGSGAILVRDYARKWNKGWRSILLLGAAYGIIEEGIMVRSFFNPSWKDLGKLATYGRWLGVNRVWAEWLTIFHSVFSITIPIFLVELTYPQRRSQVWLSTRSRFLFHGLLVLSIILGFFAFPYDAPVLAIAGCVAAVVVLGWFAKHIPNVVPSKRCLRISWKLLVPTGVSVPAVFFFLFNSALFSAAIATMTIGALLILGYERLLTHWARRGFSDLHRLGPMTGALGFWGVFWDPLLEFLGRFGTSGLGLAFVVYVLSLRRKLRGVGANEALAHLGAGLSKQAEPLPR